MHILSVTDFINTINELIHIDELGVEGEVSGFSVRQDKFVFFSVKDEVSVLECFAMSFRLDFQPEDGMKVRVYGYPAIHGKSGRFRFNVSRVEPIGDGALKKAYEALKKKLRDEGLFASERKRALPEFPERVAFIGSMESAAYTDFLRIAQNRWGGVELQIFDVRVQGAGAVDDIVSAFSFFNRMNTDVPEVIVLSRGGGSLEDLSAFNDERVARAVFGSRVPVVVGVGHEKDESLADFVADVRASTPSNAAELIFPDRVAIASRLNYFGNYFFGRMDNAVTHYNHKITGNLHLLETSVGATTNAMRSVFVSFENAFSHFERTVGQRIESIENTKRLLTNLHPQRLLKRGYSITFDAHGKVVRKKDNVATGDMLTIQLGEGCLSVELKNI